MNKIKILGITGIRSDYDMMSDFYKLISKSKKFNFKLFVTGAHLSNQYGYSFDHIKKDKIKIADISESLIDSDTLSSRVKSLSIQMQDLIQCVNKFKPKIIMVLGDREEAINAALVGNYLNKIVVHIGGGDRVIGNIDDQVRHAITSISHIHFTFSKNSYDRLVRMGEQRFRIFNIGHPGIDRLKNTKKLNLNYVFNKLNIKFSIKEKYVICLQHPLSSEYKQSYNQMKITLESLKELKINSIVIYPNSDAGSKDIIKVFNNYKEIDNFTFKKNVPRELFVNLLKNCSCLVGNSSLGILESPFLKIPVINIGNRQKGRYHSNNVFFVDHNKSQIKKNILSLTSKNYKKNNIVNPFGNGNSSKLIIKLLNKIKYDSKLFKKDLTY